jgi:hypothetical protein
MADERDRLRKLRQLEATTTPAVKTSSDPYYVRDPKTGLSPAQVDAQKALQTAQTVNQELGIASKVVTKPGSAGSISTPPGAARAGYEWYAFNLPGGGFEWRERPTRETLIQSFGGGGGGGGGGRTVVGTYTDPETGDVYLIYSDGTRELQAKGTLTADKAAADLLAAETKRKAGQSAYDLLFTQFQQYGLGALVEPLRQFIVDGLSSAEFTLRLRDTDAYKKRFAANQARIQKGLSALSEAEYIGLEDQYQDVMRRYGLPENYYSRGDMGRQEGFERFIGGDVSPVELEDRIQTAQRRVINAAPEVTASLRSFYPEIGQGDLLAYFLDPDKAIENIKRKVTAAEIGGAATMAGLATGATRAEELARYGVTQEAARQGFQTIAQVLPRGSQLAEIYKQSPYTQTTAEQEVFGLAGAPEAERQRRRLTQLETAAFSGQAGTAGGALGRERAGAI